MSDGTNTPVFCRINGKLARFEVGTSNHVQAIAAVKIGLARTRTPAGSAVLALIKGGQA